MLVGATPVGEEICYPYRMQNITVSGNYRPIRDTSSGSERGADRTGRLEILSAVHYVYYTTGHHVYRVLEWLIILFGWQSSAIQVNLETLDDGLVKLTVASSPFAQDLKKLK